MHLPRPAPVAQRIERRTSNPMVGGSNPPGRAPADQHRCPRDASYRRRHDTVCDTKRSTVGPWQVSTGVGSAAVGPSMCCRLRIALEGLVASAMDEHRRRALDRSIASRLMAGRGATVLGVEMAPRMAQIARGHGIDVEVGPFEDWEPAGRTFDRVVSAQAWHWLDLSRCNRQGRFGAAARRAPLPDLECWISP